MFGEEGARLWDGSGEFCEMRRLAISYVTSLVGLAVVVERAVKRRLRVVEEVGEEVVVVGALVVLGLGVIRFVVVTLSSFTISYTKFS